MDYDSIHNRIETNYIANTIILFKHQLS